MLRIILLLVVLQFFVLGCKKSMVPKGDGQAIASKNGEEWEAVVWVGYKSKGAVSEDTIQLNFDTYTKEGFKREHLAVFGIPLALKEIELGTPEPTRSVSSARLSLRYDDGHVLGDVYSIVVGHPLNHLELTELSSETGTIKGRFDLAMVADTSYGPKKDPSLPDTFFFTDGRFQVYMEELMD